MRFLEIPLDTGNGCMYTFYVELEYCDDTVDENLSNKKARNTAQADSAWAGKLLAATAPKRLQGRPPNKVCPNTPKEDATPARDAACEDLPPTDQGQPSTTEEQLKADLDINF